jgi:hypothetical protein
MSILTSVTFMLSLRNQAMQVQAIAALTVGTRVAYAYRRNGHIHNHGFGVVHKVWKTGRVIVQREDHAGKLMSSVVDGKELPLVIQFDSTGQEITKNRYASNGYLLMGCTELAEALQAQEAANAVARKLHAVREGVAQAFSDRTTGMGSLSIRTPEDVAAFKAKLQAIIDTL